MDFIVAVLGVACYVAAAALAFVALFRVRSKGEQLVQSLMAAGAVLLCGVLVIRGLHADHIPALNRFEALTCYVLTLTAAYFLLMATRPARGLTGILAPYAALLLACGLPAFSATAGAPPPLQDVWLAIHMALAFAAYALLTLASVLATAYLVQDSNLKNKRFGVVWERLPALETLDHLMGRQMGLGFLLLTGSILLGITLVRRSGGGEEWLTDPKVGAAAVTWVLFAVLVHMRASADRHGRGMAVVTLAGLACLLFTFIGVHVLADSVHGFVRILPAY